MVHFHSYEALIAEGNGYRGCNDMMAQTDPLFPASDRVIYQISPLFSVVCQIRFPTVLRIESEAPANFQESIRDDFPIFHRNQRPGLENIPPEIAQLIGAAANQQTQFLFASADEKTTIALSSDALAITTTSYTRWEDFESIVFRAVNALIEHYRPSFAIRTGLRYQNALVPHALGLAGHPWQDFVSSNIVGELAHPPFASGQISEAHRHIRAVTADGEGFLLQHGIGASGDESAYIIDLDCYFDERIEVSNALDRLRSFHTRAGHAFRWCISERVHEALRPQPVETVAQA